MVLLLRVLLGVCVLSAAWRIAVALLGEPQPIGLMWSVQSAITLEVILTVIIAVALFVARKS